MNGIPTLRLKEAYSACIGDDGNQGLLFTAAERGDTPKPSHLYVRLYNSENVFIGTLELRKSSGSSPVFYFVSALLNPNDTPPHNYPYARLSFGDHTIFFINARTSEE